MARLQKLTTKLRSRAVLLLTVVLAAVLGVGISSAGSGNGVIRTLGDETFQPNVKVQATLKFAPGQVQVDQGDTLTIRHDDKTEAPHTVSVVPAHELPQDFLGIIDLGAVCPTCISIADEHFGGADAGPPPGPFDVVLDPGSDGFNEVGDSVLFFEGEEVEVTVTADPGTTLSYICVIHPWMQGSINVRG